MIAAFLLAAAPSLWAELGPVYEDLHRNPELSFEETATAAKLAARLRSAGFEVTTGVGKTGIVAVLRNGPGTTVMLRTDLDGLPVLEATGLPYASRATGTNRAGETVPVMHACGHDLHMTTWLGAALELARGKDAWKGTLVMVGQPAEEIGAGARAMLDDGLFTRFPRPDAALAFHDSDALPAGTIGIKAGPMLASADSVDIVVHGRGAHGAAPHRSVDPIVIAARIVLALQTLVSRETDPFEPAVVTVGSIHGGTKHNIIPEEVRMQLTVRAYSDEVRDHLLRGIERIARAETEAAGAPRAPDVTVSEGTPTTSNDPILAERIGAALRTALGPDRVREARPITAAEDFSLYARAGVPSLMMWLGAVEPKAFEEARRSGATLPGLHSPMWAPDAERAATTGVDALVAGALELFREN